MRYLLTLLVACAACSRAGVGYVDTELRVCAPDCGDELDAQDDQGEELFVTASYVGLTAWNDYACENEICEHAGEARRAEVESLSSCDSVVATDDLDAFDWRCDDADGIVVISTRALKADRGLRDLVFATGFRNQRLVVTRGAEIIGSSAPAVWWTNPVAALPTNLATGVATLADADTVYIAATAQTSDGYNIDADGIALVTLGDATIMYSGSDTNNCNESTAETASPTHPCLVAAGGQQRLWIEANLDARTALARHALLLGNMQQSRVTHTALRGGIVTGLAMFDGTANVITDVSITETQYGLALNNADRNTLRDLTISGVYIRGLSLTESDDNRVSHVRIADAGTTGFYLWASAGNVITDIVVANTHESSAGANDGIGIHLRGATRNILTRLLVAHTVGTGLQVNSVSTENVVSHASVFASTETGVAIFQSGGQSMVQIASIRSDNDGFSVTTGPNNTNNTFADLVAAQAGTGIYIDSATTFRFGGGLWMGNLTNAPCYVAGDTQPGLITTTCTSTGTEGSSTYPGQLSDAVFHPGRDYSASLVGMTMSADAVNRSDENAVAVHDTISDWTAFESPFRTWGRNDTTNGACNSGQSCRIWDWRVTEADTALRGVNGTFSAGAACPSSADGDAVWTAGTDVFLRNATETMGDAIGDDDGLCESDEACVYSPNIGVYQGEGELTGACAFNDGAVRNVDLRTYVTNGF